MRNHPAERVRGVVRQELDAQLTLRPLTLVPTSATVKQRRAQRGAALLSSRRLLFHRLGRRGINQLADRPNVIRDSHCHRRGDPQAFMDAAQIEVSDVEADGRDVVRQLL